MKPQAAVSPSQAKGRAKRVATAVTVALAGAMGVVAAQAADVPANPGLQAGPVTLTFGGFTALEGVVRDRYEATDIGSDFNSKIPFPNNSTASNLSEFRMTARQSRLSILAQGPSDGGVSVEGYYEMDFLGDAQNANSNESNSYNPRIRNIYGLYKDSDTGFYVLAGQSWSLASLYSSGLTPRKEQVPQTIDSQYVVGYNWTRNPQLRFVKTFGNTFAAGISLESPQAQFYNGASTPSGAVTTVAGTQQLVSASSLALDYMPDVIAKVAADPGYGHYELYGLMRGFRERNSNSGINSTVTAGGIGGGLILPLVPKMLEVQASVLAGKGIGRYGSGQLPDVTLRPDSTVAAISEVHALLGVQYHPTPAWNVYGYAGREKASATAFNVGTTGYGYGSPLYNNSNCNVVNTTTNCVANSRVLTEVTLGAWWKVYQGPLGYMNLGLQGSHNQREAFAGVGGAPSTSMNAYLFSVRYYPYQH